MSSMNDLIRAASGHAPALVVPDQEPPEGDFGIGRGGAAAPRPALTSNDVVNSRLRAAVRLTRSIAHSGIDLEAGPTLDDLLGGR